VRTTIYFDLIKAFRHVDPVDYGAWILYGNTDLRKPSHDAVIEAASFPSVRADLAVWGQVYRYDDGIAVQLYLTITPIIKERESRPELWIINGTKYNGKAYRIELDIPTSFYEFEPMILPNDVVIQYEKPEGIPFYKSRKGGKPIGFLGDIIEFKEIYDDAILVVSDNKKGWVRTKSIPEGRSEAITFSKGMVRLLRGDWRGSLENFSRVLENKDIPQDLRIHSLIYSALAKEKIDHAGTQEFESAYGLNRLDKGAASYLLMSRIAEVERAKRQSDRTKLEVSVNKLRKDLDAVRVLFAKDDEWLKHVEDYLQ
jgi:hypothetical protein